LKKSVPPSRTKKEIMFTPSVFDHGIDIIGDEWDEEIENPEIEYKEKHVPEHPYCTNWPVSKKEKNENI
jgi:hypothetical protein